VVFPLRLLVAGPMPDKNQGSGQHGDPKGAPHVRTSSFSIAVKSN
jgi:hypothetical protein